MKKRIVSIVAGLVLVAGTALAAGHGGHHWGYEGDTGPLSWGKLDPAYEMCAKGKNQAPVDLSRFVEADLPPIPYTDNGAWDNIVNNGHSIQINTKEGSTIQIDGITFSLLQFHFHSPSENLINGKSFPMEAHFVHADKDGNLAVVALMFEYGPENKVLKKLWEKMPKEPGQKVQLEPAFKPYELLPQNRDYDRFNGSLTTPPCSEGVRWIVLKSYATVSKEQVEQFKKVMGHPNNRPVQPLNARVIMK